MPVEVTGGRLHRGVGLALSWLVLVAVVLGYVGVASFVLTTVCAIGATVVCAWRWRASWSGGETMAGRRIAAVALIVLSVVVFLRKHDASGLPLGRSPDMAHHTASVMAIEDLERPLRSGDTERVAFPDFAAYPVTGQYSAAQLAWALHLDPARALDLVAFGAIGATLWFLWAIGANLGAAALADRRARAPAGGAALVGSGWAAALGFVPVLLYLAASGFGVKLVTEHYFHAQMVGVAAVAYGLSLVVTAARGAEVPAVELGLACVLVTYSYPQYALVVPAAYAAVWVLRRERRASSGRPGGAGEQAYGVPLSGRHGAVVAIMALIGIAAYFAPRYAASHGAAAVPGVIPEPSVALLGGIVCVVVMAAGVALGLLSLRRSNTRTAAAAAGPLAALVASLGQIAALVVAGSSWSPVSLPSSQYYRLKNVYTALVPAQALAVLAVVPLVVAAGSLRRVRRFGRLTPVIAAVASVVLVGTASAYAQQHPAFDTNEHEAVRWARAHVPAEDVEVLEVGLSGYMLSVGGLGRSGGAWDHERLNGRYPVQVWYANPSRRYVVTADEAPLLQALGPDLAARLKVLHRNGRAAVLDRGGGGAWFGASLRWAGAPVVDADGSVVLRVSVTNTGIAPWPPDPGGDPKDFAVAGVVRATAWANPVPSAGASATQESAEPDEPAGETFGALHADTTTATLSGETVEVTMRLRGLPAGTYRVHADAVSLLVTRFAPALGRALEATVVVPEASGA